MDIGLDLTLAVIITAGFPWYWREVKKWQDASEPTSWPATTGRLALVKAGLAVFVAAEWARVLVRILT